MTRQRGFRLAAAIRSALGAVVSWLTLLLIGVLAIPAFLLISLMGALWELADITTRAIDS